MDIKYRRGGTFLNCAPGHRPVFGRDGADVSKGSRELLRFGAAPLAVVDLEDVGHQPEWLRGHGGRKRVDPGLFD